MTVRSGATQIADLMASMAAPTFSQSTRDAARRTTLHILGMSVLGTSLPTTSRVIRFCHQYEPGICTVVNSTAGAVPSGAVFANVTACHEDFREDSHSGSQSHPAAVVIPSALAVGQVAQSADPNAFLEAIVQGIEATARIGEAGATASTPRGFRPSSIYPVFGAAVAAGRMLGLDRDGISHAVGLAAHSAAGLNQPLADGTEDWFLSPGLAARAGVSAALLAASGLETTRNILDGESGFFAAYAGRTGANIDVHPPTGSRLCEIERLRLKGALTCGWNQSLVHLLARLPDADPNDIASVDVWMSGVAAHYPGVGLTGPFRNRSAALLSAPFAAALFLTRRRLAPDGYTDLDAKDVNDLAKVINVRVESSYVGYDTRVDVGYRDSRVISLEHLNSDDPHSLTNFDDVLDNLRAAFRDAGRDDERVDRLARGVERALATGDLLPLSAALVQ